MGHIRVRTHTHTHTYTHTRRKRESKIAQLFAIIIGELDPDRVGSGIQYGNAQIRKTAPQQTPREHKKCC